MNRRHSLVSFVAAALALLALLAVPAAAAPSPAGLDLFPDMTLSSDDSGCSAGVTTGALAQSSWSCEDQCEQAYTGCHEFCSELPYDHTCYARCWQDFEDCMAGC